MGLTRRQTLLKRKVHQRDALIFVVATEGTVTEPAYFKAFNPAAESRAPFSPSPLHVEVLPPLSHRSSPDYILKNVLRYVRDKQLDPRDEIWLVLDVDEWEPLALAKVCASAKRHKFNVVISNPCFEVWLCLHFVECSDAEIALKVGERDVGNYLKHLWRTYLPPSATDIERSHLRPKAHIACERARSNEPDDIGPQCPWPSAPATRVHHLVERILKVLGE